MCLLLVNSSRMLPRSLSNPIDKSSETLLDDISFYIGKHYERD